MTDHVFQAGHVLGSLPPCPVLFPQAALTGRVPWPTQAQNAPLNPPPQVLAKMAVAPLPCVRLGYALFYLPEETGEALLRLALSAAQLVLAADFKLAERNLELPATLAAHGLAGLARLTEHLRRSEPGFAGHGFLRHGGLEGLAHRAGAKVLERRTLLGGAAVLLHLRRA